ncbi:tail sheath stabilizer and completion protein [uncultured Caudovirales phage]|uniref:Tail sheath stabilizer and completion protein n=1 Tax=uncultured Caudovirales phage TaxID=2100421 RepID=A0A6J5LKF9_9CAUD|nr:tail sheath stabilizer and completion protein [uncultured Caudovirales phage]
MATTSYNRIIRKIVTGFGSLFDNITLVRYNTDETEQERVLVPLAYATKERYIMRLQEDPTLDKRVQITLPRMSFEMTGLSYDSSRKQNTNMKSFAQTANGVKSQYNPVPYNFQFSLYLYVRNIEDGMQIIEHILPFFTPDYTIKLNLIPEMCIVKEIPVVLDSSNYEVTYEGPRDDDTRMVIWTLNFTVKGFIFGATSASSIIKDSITNIFNGNMTNSEIIFNVNAGGTGSYQQGEIVYQGFSLDSATATAKVVSFVPSNNQLTVKNISGNFISTEAIHGVNTNASWTFNNYHVVPEQFVKIEVTPNPTTANADSIYTYTTVIQEEPNIT